MINNVNIEGYVFDAPVFKSNKSNEEFAALFTLTHKVGVDKETGKGKYEYYPVQIIGEGVALTDAHNLQKDDFVHITGSIRKSSYEDANGEKKYRYYIKASTIMKSDPNYHVSVPKLPRTEEDIPDKELPF